MDAAETSRLHGLIFQAEDALDMAVMAVTGTQLTTAQLSEIRASLTTVRVKAALLASKLGGPDPAS